MAKQQLAPLGAIVQQLRADLDTLRVEVDKRELDTDQESRYRLLAATETASALEDLRTSSQDQHRTIAEVAEAVGALRLTIENDNELHLLAEAERREAKALLAGYRCSFDMLFGPAGRYASRFVTDDEVLQLVEQLSRFDEGDTIVAALHQAYRLLIEVELRGIGRLAGSTPNALAKLTAIALLSAPSREVLEIGTLFGLGAVAVMRQLARSGVDPFITIVDPLAGHQIQPGRGAELDVSATPATRAIVEANLQLGGVTPRSFRLIEGFSGDDRVLDAIGDRSYGLIVIDGDHGEDAALSDLLLAERVAADDALVLLDDYRDPAWPGVEKALERYVGRDGSRLEVVSTAATTAFLRARPAV